MVKPLPPAPEQQDEILAMLGELSNDPLRFVLWAFPWGEEGTELEKWDGPFPWQRKVLEHIRDNITNLDEAIRIAVASGHDIGKSALVSWLILWAISTREDTRGVVTAGTGSQLKTKTWPEVAKWVNLSLCGFLFEFSDTSIHSTDATRKSTWRVDQVTWNKDRPEAFSGLHNVNKRILVVYDEASQIDDSIWAATDGILYDRDTQIVWVAFGNPTRKGGRFFECWHRFASLWKTHQVDSRDVPVAKKSELDAQIEAWGIESDYVKVRILGQFPSTATIQFMDADTVKAARLIRATSHPFDPFIIGVDVSRYGDAESVLFRRRGRDARSWPPTYLRGLSITELVDHIVAVISAEQPDAVFIDEGGVGGGVVDGVLALGHQCIGIQFGSKPGSRPAGALVANKRAEMYYLAREWLRTGGAIPDEEELEQQLTNIDYSLNKRDEILLESKEDMRSRGIKSPDRADALCLTFAMPVEKKFVGRPGRKHQVEYEGWSLETAA